MMEFFKPWRRKIGVVTLALACVAMVGWVNSQTVKHRVSFPVGETTLGWIGSGDSVLYLHWYPASRLTVQEVRYTHEVDERVGTDELGYGVHKHGSSLRYLRGLPNVVQLPYWMIVLPLTLLSAYLLLSRPRPAKPVAPSEPDHA